MKKTVMLGIICLMTIMATRPFLPLQVLGQTPVPPDEKQKILDNLNKMLNQVQTQTAAITALKGIRILPSLSFSNSSFSVYGVGLDRTI